MSAFPVLRHPIVGAPLAGGPSTAALCASVSRAGGLGFLAAGYLSGEAVRAQIDETRALTDAPFGVNVFLLSERAVDENAVARYAELLRPEAERLGVELGTPQFEDDAFEEKLALVDELAPAVVSFTFGCPSRAVVERLQARGIAVWVTVTEPDEAEEAEAAGADALVVQGVEAGGHRGTFVDADGRGEHALLPLLCLVAARVALPLVAAGGIADGRDVAAVLSAGARAAQLGTALLLAPEAGTHAALRAAIARGGETGLTRAFTGRRARGIVNRFQTEHTAHAPAAYPHVHHLTAPLRAAARAAGDADATNLWAGEEFAHAVAAPAGELVRRLAADVRALLATEGERLRIDA